ncbi:MAG: HD domain-containing protein [Desulfobacterales bacterium]|nr:HD domain-containing protein [Desulfobacterales bacterium]
MKNAGRGITHQKGRVLQSQSECRAPEKGVHFLQEAHCAQKRVEGSPYIHHPLAVADILADMKLDTATIASGLLHDTVEDTGMSTDDIRDMFSNEIAFLVDAVTKLSKVEFQTKEDAQAENFRKMLLAMSKDVRVILIKFADRLHNMKTLEFLPEDKRRRIATETLEIFAPLANRLGIGWLRTEFEDLCFQHLMPDLYHDLEAKVAKRKEEQKQYIDEVVHLISERLHGGGCHRQDKEQGETLLRHLPEDGDTEDPLRAGPRRVRHQGHNGYRHPLL